MKPGTQVIEISKMNDLISSTGTHCHLTGGSRVRYPRKTRRFRKAGTTDCYQPTHPEPATLFSTEVCPHCQRRTAMYRFTTDGSLLVTTYHCTEHGDVVLARGSVGRDDPPPTEAPF